ncbi:MAG: hypothetical protein AAF378_09440 [Cyanobacteria bacterium P01_A01_bin.84]
MKSTKLAKIVFPVLATASLISTSIATTVNAASSIPEREPNNTLSQAHNLGGLLRTGQREPRSITVKGSMNGSDRKDIFRVLPGNQAASTLEINLSDLRGKASVVVYKDVNFNRQVDRGESVDSKFGTGKLTLKGINDGVYYVAVNRSGSANVSYNLNIKAIPGVGRESGNLTDMGHIIAPRSFKGSVRIFRGPQKDLYSFGLSTTRKVNITVADPRFSSDIRVKLYKDSNRNGRPENSEFVADVPQSGPRVPSKSLLKRSLSSGRYLIQISATRGITNYTLNASAR